LSVTCRPITLIARRPSPAFHKSALLDFFDALVRPPQSMSLSI
jgi:hypothetical protein